MKGKYTEISNKYSNDLKTVISLLLEVNPLYRPDTKKILELREVKDKIEEYEIFKNDKWEKGKDGFQHKKFFSNQLLSNINSEERQSREEINKLKKGLLGKELNVIYENENEENKMVMDTIHMPKQLIMLNKRLPSSNYEKDKENEMEIQKIKNLQHCSFPSVILPKLDHRYLKNSPKNNKNDIHLKSRSKVIKNAFSNDNLLQDNYDKISTLQMKIQNQMLSSRNVNMMVE